MSANTNGEVKILKDLKFTIGWVGKALENTAKSSIQNLRREFAYFSKENVSNVGVMKSKKDIMFTTYNLIQKHVAIILKDYL